MSDLTESELKAQAHQQLARLTVRGEAPRPGQIYDHYKGGLYTVLCTSIKEDTYELLVTYHSNALGTDTTRTLANFTETVTLPPEEPFHTEVIGATVPRFRRVLR